VFLLMCIACNVEVMLAAVLGCLTCMRVQCLYFVAMVLGLGGGGDASLGARLLGMRSSALANAHSMQCRGDASCGVRMLGMHACAMSLLCRYGAWLGRRR